MAEKRTDDGKLANNASSDHSVKEDRYNSTHDLDSDFVDGPEWKGNDDRNCVLTLFVRYRKAEGKKIVKEAKIIPCSWNFLAYWNFYTKNKHGQKMLDDIVKKYGCSVTVCTDDEDFFIFEVTGTSFKQERDFLYFVNDVLDNIYKYAKQSLCCDFFSVDHRIQEDTLQRVKEKEELHSAWIELVGEHDPDAVYVVCAVKDKVSVLDVLTAIISEAKEHYNNHEDTVAIDFIWQRVLKVFGYLQDLNDKFPNLMIKTDEAKHTVVLKGSRDESKAAADHLLELFGSARGEVHEKVFSPVCQFEILTYPEMCDYIDNSIPKLPVVWMPNNLTKKIHIFSKQPEQAKGIDKSVKGCIHDRLYPLSKNHSLLHPGVRPLEKLKKKHKGKIVIHATDAGLLVTTADDVFETVDADIQEIISRERAGLCSWTYEDRVLLAGLNSEVNSDNLTNFLEAKVGLTPTKFMYGDKEDKVIITFDENIEMSIKCKMCRCFKVMKDIHETCLVCTKCSFPHPCSVCAVMGRRCLVQHIEKTVEGLRKRPCSKSSKHEVLTNHPNSELLASFMENIDMPPHPPRNIPKIAPMVTIIEDPIETMPSDSTQAILELHIPYDMHITAALLMSNLDKTRTICNPIWQPTAWTYECEAGYAGLPSDF